MVCAESSVAVVRERERGEKMPLSKTWAAVAVCGVAAASCVAVWLLTSKREKGLPDFVDDFVRQVSGGEARNVRHAEEESPTEPRRS